MESEKVRSEPADSQDRLCGRERNFRRLYLHPSIGPPWRSQVPNLRLRSRQGNRGRVHPPGLALPHHLGKARQSGRTTTILRSSQGTALSLIHISEPTRRTPISYAVF